MNAIPIVVAAILVSAVIRVIMALAGYRFKYFKEMNDEQKNKYIIGISLFLIGVVSNGVGLVYNMDIYFLVPAILLYIAGVYYLSKGLKIIKAG